MITELEIQTARMCIKTALEKGADSIRISLNKSVSDSITILNGETDKVSHSADRSFYFYMFVEGKYGTFSTNRLDERELDSFIENAIAMVKMLGEDECRRLPEPERMEKDARSGLELGLYDTSYSPDDTDSRLARAAQLAACSDKSPFDTDGFEIISEECEYTESYDDTFLIDSQGFEGRHTETTFSGFSEITVCDKDGNKYSGFWWENSPFYDKLGIDSIRQTALSRAVSQIGPRKRKGGHYKMVVDTSVTSRLVSPLLTALNASSIQQKMSFLDGSLGKKIFSEGFTLLDLARTYGKSGSRLFDTEGVATKDAAIIERGVVKQYFVNTYMAAKTGMEPTIEDMSRPCMRPFIKDEDLAETEKEVSLKDILKLCGSGIYVTGFNGGNCNPVTGDFSYGIEGFAFKNGKITHPVKEMLITGNMIQLWNSLIAVGSDARECSRWHIPSLAFEGVSFSA